MTVNVIYLQGNTELVYICLSPSINVPNAYHNCLDFKFGFLLSLLMRLYLLPNSFIIKIYLKLSNIEMLVINACLVNEMYAVVS